MDWGEQLKHEVYARVVQPPTIYVDWFMPSGRPRSTPLFVAELANDFLGSHRTLKERDQPSLLYKARLQLEKWAEKEFQRRLLAAKRGAKEQVRLTAEQQDADAKVSVQSVRDILATTLTLDDRIDWESLCDTTPLPALAPAPAAPSRTAYPPEPVMPERPMLAKVSAKANATWQRECQHIAAHYQHQKAQYDAYFQAQMQAWHDERARAVQKHEAQVAQVQRRQYAHNQAVWRYKQRFEAGDPRAILEYLELVFERSQYPAEFRVNHVVVLYPTTKVVLVRLSVPNPAELSDTAGFKFVARGTKIAPIKMKKTEHAKLYGEAVKQSVLRTMHEVFEAMYTPHVQQVIVNVFATAVDPKTGHPDERCIVSAQAERAEFETLNLASIEPTACLQGLGSRFTPPLAQLKRVAPTVPNASFVGEVEAENLADMSWQDFEVLVGELFKKLFPGEGVSVEVTQQSRDHGIDAIVEDPDPIRGGKLVVQAKHYRKAVPPSAVRELYGTVLSAGASKGILVTTAHFGRDSFTFARDKPLTLIDGGHLLDLLDKHGFNFRNDR